MRARVTLGCYRTIGIDDCIATAQDAHADLAVAIATNSERREHIRQQILAKNEPLYENEAIIRELEDALAQAYRSRFTS
jgi:predicted O-linked N-acetylglucosamine transferase (SPINDLY family)